YLLLLYCVSPSLHHSILFFFFTTLCRPPSSTLFPTRRSSDLNVPQAVVTLAANICAPPAERLAAAGAMATLRTRSGEPLGRRSRSEEDTSELQSRGHLVCRLLLEKKKKTQKIRKIVIYADNNT